MLPLGTEMSTAQDRTSGRPALLSCPVRQDRTTFQFSSCPVRSAGQGSRSGRQDRTRELEGQDEPTRRLLSYEIFI